MYPANLLLHDEEGIWHSVNLQLWLISWANDSHPRTAALIVAIDSVG